MRLPLRDPRRRAVVVPFVVVALGVAPAASAEIYKCLEKNGMERYQNFPCAIDSVRATPDDSWHIFEQSGRLFVPNCRTKSW